MKQITWMHPSYRDLVIEELQTDHWLRSIYLKTVNIEGIQLALSDSGGPYGQLHNPLMVDDESWDILQQRCIQIVSQPNLSAGFGLLNLLSRVYLHEVSAKAKELELKIIQDICGLLLIQSNEKRVVLTNFQVETYIEASLLITPLIQIPNLLSTWTSQYNKLLLATISENSIDLDEIERWLNLVLLISQSEPRFFRQIKFPVNNLADIQKIIFLLNNEVYFDDTDLTIDDLEGLEETYSRLGGTIRDFSILIEPVQNKLLELADNLNNICESIRNKINDIPEIEQDQEMDIIHSDLTDEVDIQTLFRDL